MRQAFSAIIPAAGLSDRMGTAKAMLLYDDETTFADHILDCYVSAGCSPVVMVINPAFDTSKLKNRHFVPVMNDSPELGRSHSIHLGLQLIPEGSACFIHNVDNPFAEIPLLVLLMNAVGPGNYAVPAFEGKSGHPVLLGKNVAGRLRLQPAGMDFRRELKQFPRIGVSFPDERIRLNINTPGDYLRFAAENRSYRKKM